MLTCTGRNIEEKCTDGFPFHSDIEGPLGFVEKISIVVRMNAMTSPNSHTDDRAKAVPSELLLNQREVFVVMQCAGNQSRGNVPNSGLFKETTP
jgi:hypothetical protein